MSEPVIDENITDIDGKQATTLEFDLTAGALRSTRTRAGVWRSALEAEWRPFDRAGMGVELETVGTLDDARPTGAVHLAPRGALSYVVLRDFERRVFLQLEAGARADDGVAVSFADPTEAAQPYWAGLREAAELGPIDLRAAAFGEGGGSASAHAPVRASGAALFTLVGASVRAAVGAEALADWSRGSPFAVAPEAQVVARPLGYPLRLEIAVPFTVGARGGDGAWGVAFRFVLEPDE
jgi:hypothetical protein